MGESNGLESSEQQSYHQQGLSCEGVRLPVHERIIIRSLTPDRSLRRTAEGGLSGEVRSQMHDRSSTRPLTPDSSSIIRSLTNRFRPNELVAKHATGTRCGAAVAPIF